MVVSSVRYKYTRHQVNTIVSDQASACRHRGSIFLYESESPSFDKSSPPPKDLALTSRTQPLLSSLHPPSDVYATALPGLREEGATLVVEDRSGRFHIYCAEKARAGGGGSEL